jgi:hypothetical protein
MKLKKNLRFFDFSLFFRILLFSLLPHPSIVSPSPFYRQTVSTLPRMCLLYYPPTTFVILTNQPTSFSFILLWTLRLSVKARGRTLLHSSITIVNTLTYTLSHTHSYVYLLWVDKACELKYNKPFPHRWTNYPVNLTRYDQWTWAILSVVCKGYTTIPPLTLLPCLLTKVI